MLAGKIMAIVNLDRAGIFKPGEAMREIALALKVLDEEERLERR